MQFSRYIYRLNSPLPYGSGLYKPMGLSGLEPPTSRLSGVRSNRLSYKPILIWRPPTLPHRLQCSTIGRPGLNHRVRDGYGCFPRAHRHQKILGSWRGIFEPRTKIVHRTWRSLFEPSKVNVFPFDALSSALPLP